MTINMSATLIVQDDNKHECHINSSITINMSATLIVQDDNKHECHINSSR